MLADFTIAIEGARKPLAVRVKVHDNEESLNRATRRYNEIWNPSENKDERVLGVCHRFHWDGEAVCALVRLAPPHIGAGMVAHELCHAAVWVWEIQHKFEETSRLNCENDEWFCWILGDLVRQTTTKLIEKEIY